MSSSVYNYDSLSRKENSHRGACLGEMEMCSALSFGQCFQSAWAYHPHTPQQGLHRADQVVLHFTAAYQWLRESSD